MLGSRSASLDLCRLPSNFNAAADIFMERLTKCLRGDQTRFTSAITTTMRGHGGGRGLGSPEAPRIACNSAHLSCPQQAGPGAGGGGDESDTVPAHGEPAVCGRERHTHKLHASLVAGTGTRWEEGCYLSHQSQGQEGSRARGSRGHQLLWLSWSRLCPGRAPGALRPASPASGSQSLLSFTLCTPVSAWGSFSPG